MPNQLPLPGIPSQVRQPPIHPRQPPAQQQLRVREDGGVELARRRAAEEPPRPAVGEEGGEGGEGGGGFGVEVVWAVLVVVGWELGGGGAAEVV